MFSPSFVRRERVSIAIGDGELVEGVAVVWLHSDRHFFIPAGIFIADMDLAIAVGLDVDAVTRGRADGALHCERVSGAGCEVVVAFAGQNGERRRAWAQRFHADGLCLRINAGGGDGFIARADADRAVAAVGVGEAGAVACVDAAFVFRKDERRLRLGDGQTHRDLAAHAIRRGDRHSCVMGAGWKRRIWASQ